jgi:electron transfer flavoprotein beta subunit
MKILVPVKRVVDYNVKFASKQIKPALKPANVKMSMNPFDEIAIEEAVKLKEAGSLPKLWRYPLAQRNARKHWHRVSRWVC